MNTRLTVVNGNLLEAQVEALVNTVNCVGQMGKGIALQFKLAFPENNKYYQAACMKDEVELGKVLTFHCGLVATPRYIFNFPTKKHWRGKSRIEDIQSGLDSLIEEVQTLGVKSIAVPPLGCGLGGLDWAEVRPIIESAFAGIDVEVHLYAPTGAPQPSTRPVHTKRPALTVAKALYLKLMASYREMDFSLTLLEVHKLAYLMQTAGQPLRLNFQKGKYGPYAENLDHVLRAMESHYIAVRDDSRTPQSEVELLPNSIGEANTFLADMAVERARLLMVQKLIEGFETPFGMELLTSVHWVTVGDDDSRASTLDEAVDRVQSWNDRKRGLFTRRHIELAWDRLAELGWIS